MHICFAVPAVGFLITEEIVPEALPRKFVCVQIQPSSGPLASGVEIEFFTQDGSAKG